MEHQDSTASSTSSTICFSIRSILIPSSMLFRSYSLFHASCSCSNAIRVPPHDAEDRNSDEDVLVS